MKNAVLLCVIIFLSSCSQPPSQFAIQTAIAQTQLALPPITASPFLTATSTDEPLPTGINSPAASETPSLSPSPSVTFPATDSLVMSNLPVCIPQNTEVDQAAVVQVVDGDNIIVRLADGNTYPVRYIGIDSPERDRPFYADAIIANSSLVNQKQVILIKDVSETDQYGRLLRYVVAEEVFVNLELVKRGFARTESYPPDMACAQEFSSAEDEARAALIGMWAATQTPEPASPQIIITGVNKREEWVEIQNIGNFDVDLSGWNLVSERGNQECILSGVLKTGEILRIWSGISQGSGFACGYSNPIWNNSESDPAVLYNPQGIEVSRK